MLLVSIYLPFTGETPLWICLPDMRFKPTYLEGVHVHVQKFGSTQLPRFNGLLAYLELLHEALEAQWIQDWCTVQSCLQNVLHIPMQIFWDFEEATLHWVYCSHLFSYLPLVHTNTTYSSSPCQSYSLDLQSRYTCITSTIAIDTCS